MCRPIWKEELYAAVGLILGADPDHDAQTQILEFLSFASKRNFDLTTIYAAYAADRLLWAAFPILSPGRTALVLSPPLPPPPPYHNAAVELLRHACASLVTKPVALIQALVEPANPVLREIHASAGFDFLAELVYLHALPPSNAAIPPTPTGFTLHTYSPQNHPLFAQAILASYHQSLDCPALNGLRNIEDIIAGHKATGDFDPNLWFLLTDSQQTPFAVLLLGSLPRADAVELVYLGLVPESRGRGLGDFFMRLALATARQKQHRLTLAVDALNNPALGLYHRHGMQRIASKLAMIRSLPKTPPVLSRPKDPAG